MLNSMASHEKIAKHVPVSSSGRPLLHCNNPPQAIYFSFAMDSGIMLGDLIIPDRFFQTLNSTKGYNAF